MRSIAKQPATMYLGCLALVAALGTSGCPSGNSSGNSGTVPKAAPTPRAAASGGDEVTWIVPLPEMERLFDNQRPFLFEVNGPPINFHLQVTWGNDPGPNGKLLYEVSGDDVVNIRHMDLPGEPKPTPDYLALLLPKDPKGKLAVHFQQGGSMSRGTSLPEILPDEAKQLELRGYVDFGGSSQETTTLRSEKTKPLVTWMHVYGPPGQESGQESSADADADAASRDSQRWLRFDLSVSREPATSE